MVMRRNIALCIILSIITCGIYSLIWLVFLTDDLNTISGEPDTTGIITLLLVIITCGLYGIYWAYKCGDKIDKIKLRRNIPASSGGVLYLILYVFGGIIAYALIQNEINNLA